MWHMILADTAALMQQLQYILFFFEATAGATVKHDAALDLCLPYAWCFSGFSRRALMDVYCSSHFPPLLTLTFASCVLSDCNAFQATLAPANAIEDASTTFSISVPSSSYALP
jgi:hypothetical protein